MNLEPTNKRHRPRNETILVVGVDDILAVVRTGTLKKSGTGRRTLFESLTRTTRNTGRIGSTIERTWKEYIVACILRKTFIHLGLTILEQTV